MNQKVIVIDGKTYNSVDDMPPDIRRKYETALGALDKNRDGTPDMLENINAMFEDKNRDGMPDAFDGLTGNVVSATKIIADGREYNSMEELPPEVRAKLSQAMGKLDANQNGVPDFLEGTLTPSAPAANVDAVFETPAPRRTPPVPAPVIEPESTSGWALAFAGLFVLLLCAAGAVGVWYFFLR